MKIAIHISFFFMIDRLKYINRIIAETDTYKLPADIFIHTNKQDLTITNFHTYKNGTISIIWHDLSKIDPHLLTWKCRDLLKNQKNEYDIFMYIEDDILVPYNAIQYWIKYHPKLIQNNFNLGFLRIEIKNGEEYMTDITRRFSTFTNIESMEYCVNNINPYCAFWIYDKNEFHKFVNSKYYDIKNIKKYGTRESSAIGYTPFYNGTLIPLVNHELDPDCRIYHLPNNYVMSNNRSGFGKIKFKDAFHSEHYVPSTEILPSDNNYFSLYLLIIIIVIFLTFILVFSVIKNYL